MKNILFAISAFALVCPFATPVEAQQTCASVVMTVATAARESGNDGDLTDQLNFNTGTACLVGLILKAESDILAKQSFAQIASEIKAAFQQNGSSTGTGGSTNLVSKGITAQILSLAAEYGALTESTSGSTVTLQGTLGGIPQAFETQSILPPCGSAIDRTNSACISSNLVNTLNRISYSIGFNTSQNSQSVTGMATSTSSTASTLPTDFTANSQTLNSVAAKVALVQAPVANAAAVSSAITKLTTTSPSVKANKAMNDARKKLMADCPNTPNTVLASWMQEAENTLEKATMTTTNLDEFSAIWYGLGPGLIAALEAQEPCNSKYAADVQSVASALNAYLVSLNTFFEGLRGTPVLSLEYDYNTPASQPSNSTVRLIGQLSKKNWTGTLNAAGSFYNSTPSPAIPGASRVRDFQVAAEGNYNFGKEGTSNPIFGNSTASLAYYYQDQTSPAILNVTPGQPVNGITFTGLPSTATQVYAKKGVINIGQAKFTLNPANSGITFPVSVTWSNRTELVTKPTWRGQIGISYDLDSLFSKSK